MVCAVDPQTTSMLVPLAQATIIALPIIFRANIAAAVRRHRGMTGTEIAEASQSSDDDAELAAGPPDGSTSLRGSDATQTTQEPGADL
jgi:hypothetical protein